MAALTAVFLMVPAPLNIGVLIGYCGIFFMVIVLSCVSISLLAVLTKSMITTAVGGVAVWYGLLTLSYTSWSPIIVKWILNPVNMFSQYLGGGEGAPVIGDLLFVIGLVSLMVALFLGSSIALFRKTEA